MTAQSLTCHLRGVSGVGREFSNEQDCEYILTNFCLQPLNFAIHFPFLGSSLNIVYPNLNAGKYVLRVVGNAVTGGRAVIRREFQIGNNTTMQYNCHSTICEQVVGYYT